MARSFLIRPARADDAPENARLATELGYPATPGEMEPRLAAILPQRDRLVAVAEDSSPLLLGWVAAERRLLLHCDARAELIGLVVGSNARRRGVGKALVLAAEEWTMAQGLPGIFVRSSTTRIESHTFYESLGYRQNTTQHSYFKTQAGRSPAARAAFELRLAARKPLGLAAIQAANFAVSGWACDFTTVLNSRSRCFSLRS